MMTSGQLLRKFRENRGMTQVALAKAAKVNRVTVTQMENGKTRLTHPALARLAKALKIRKSDLIE